jgi:hypothetical protein
MDGQFLILLFTAIVLPIVGQWFSYYQLKSRLPLDKQAVSAQVGEDQAQTVLVQAQAFKEMFSLAVESYKILIETMKLRSELEQTVGTLTIKLDTMQSNYLTTKQQRDEAQALNERLQRRIDEEAIARITIQRQLDEYRMREIAKAAVADEKRSTNELKAVESATSDS